jgi:hypothetical protein
LPLSSGARLCVKRRNGRSTCCSCCGQWGGCRRVRRGRVRGAGVLRAQTLCFSSVDFTLYSLSSLRSLLLLAHFIHPAAHHTLYHSHLSLTLTLSLRTPIHHTTYQSLSLLSLYTHRIHHVTHESRVRFGNTASHQTTCAERRWKLLSRKQPRLA